MTPVLWQITNLLGTFLHVMVIFTMARGGWQRRYPVLFCYSILNCAVTLVEWLILACGVQTKDNLYRYLYWADEFILQTAVFAMVLSLIARALDDNPARRKVVIGLLTGALALAVVSYLPSQGRHGAFLQTAYFMTAASRNLSFASAVLNLVLWASLARSRHPETQLLLVSGGLGLQTTGKAIGHSLRVITRSSRPLIMAGDILIVISYLFCLFVWWRAFSEAGPLRDAARQGGGQDPLPGPGTEAHLFQSSTARLG